MIFYVLLFGASVVGFIIGCMFCAITTSSKMRELEVANVLRRKFPN
jgi:adenine C2-methylase RlmN of 23S rRNA A2503 and tRNA A37